MTDTLLTVTAHGARGDGIAVNHDGAPIFAPGTALGDRIQLIDDRSGVLAEKGPHHAEPRCPHFGACGGCQLQFMTDSHFSEWVKVPIVRALEQHGLEANIRSAIMSPPRSRRRASLSVAWSDMVLKIGFQRARSHEVIDVTDCAVLLPSLLKTARDFKPILEAFLPQNRVGRLTLTQTATGQDVLVQELAGDRAELAKRLATFGEENRAIARINANLDSEMVTVFLRKAPVALFGDARVPLPPESFLQATDHGEIVLLDTVCSAVGNGRRVADLFCGLGTFSFPMAKMAKVDAFEGALSAIQAMRAAKSPPALKPIHAVHRDLFRRPLLPQELKSYDAVVFDPPRAGAKDQCVQLAQSKVASVVAVSCNPHTFARDARILVDGGYQLNFIQPVGQFLWSNHVELVAHFTR